MTGQKKIRKPPQLPKLGQRWFKNAGAILTLAVSFGAVIIERGMIGLESYTQEELLEAMDASARLTDLVGTASILQALGGLLVPVYALLLVEGFLHTSSLRRYLARLTVTALVSEPVYDYAMRGTLLDFERQGPLLSMAMCLTLLILLRHSEKLPMVERVILSVLSVFCAAFWVTLINSDRGIALVALTAVLYCFRDRTIPKIALGVLVSAPYPLAPLAFCAIIFYRGERNLKLPPWTYYAFYPVHLAALSVCAHFV